MSAYLPPYTVVVPTPSAVSTLNPSDPLLRQNEPLASQFEIMLTVSGDIIVGPALPAVLP